MRSIESRPNRSERTVTGDVDWDNTDYQTLTGSALIDVVGSSSATG